VSKIITTTLRCDGCGFETLTDGDGLLHGWAYCRLSRWGQLKELELCIQCADAVEWALQQRRRGLLIPPPTGAACNSKRA